MKKLNSQEQNLSIRFIIYNLKNLLTDNRGNYLYIDEFDKFMKDTFGVKKFGSKLIKSRSPQETKLIIRSVDINVLHTMFNTTTYYELINTLLPMINKIEQLGVKIRKAEKKKKKIPSSVKKEYLYLKKLYGKAIKQLTKDLHIDISAPYKSAYSNAVDFVKKKNKYGIDPFDIGLDFDPFYDYGDDGFEEEDRFTQFLRESEARRPIPNPRSRAYNSYHAEEPDFDDEEDYEDYGEDEEYDDEEYDEALDNRLSGIESTLRTLSQYVTGRMSSVDNTKNFNTDEYEFNTNPINTIINGEDEEYAVDADDDYEELSPSEATTPEENGKRIPTVVEQKIFELLANQASRLDKVTEVLLGVNTRLTTMEDDLYEPVDSDENFEMSASTTPATVTVETEASADEIEDLGSNPETPIAEIK